MDVGDHTAMTKPQAVLIAGPTASGKSELALRIAELAGGVVVNADSMQVYTDLRILTARPSDAEVARAPHRLYGFVDGADAYSAGRYARDAERILGDVRHEGGIPIFVGGTGLYFRVLLEGLSPIPPVPEAVRAHWRGEATRLGARALHDVLAGRDAVMAERLMPTDPQRIVRALEVLEATGRSLAEWQGKRGRPLLDASQCVRLVLMPPREQVYARCDARLEIMVRSGALEEVERLLARNLSPELPLMRAVGVPALGAHVAGTLSLEAAIAQAQRETRQYAKRQMTWLRRNMCSWIIHETKDSVDFRAFYEFKSPDRLS